MTPTAANKEDSTEKGVAKVGNAIDRSALYAVYLYYFKAGEAPGAERIYEYYDISGPISTAATEKLITKLALNAYLGGDNPRCYCIGSEYLMMRRRGYVVFVLESDDVLTNDGDTVFYSKKDESDARHTFQEKNYLNLMVGDASEPKRLHIAYCVNYMQDADEKPLGEKVSEDFIIYLPFGERKDGFRAPTTGGTNMGPPVPPPSSR